MDSSGSIDIAFSALGFFGQDMVAESALADEFAAAGDFDTFCRTLVGF